MAGAIAGTSILDIKGHGKRRRKSKETKTNNINCK